MTKRQQPGQVSVRKRREEMQRQKEARQRRLTLIGVGAALVLLLVVAAVLLTRDGDEAQVAPETLTGERPLADLEPSARDGYFSEYPPMVIDTDSSYEAVIETEKGDIRLALFPEDAPLTVNNFVYLANQGFYDGTTFHRVLEDFMAQAGDPSATGGGGPGYQFEDETDNGLTFDRRGLLAMANAGPNTNGSQFFLTFVPTPHLDGAHTIFGEVVAGDEVLDQITRVNPGQPGDVIERIVIEEN